MVFKFVYAGRLDQEKGIEDIVFAVRKILEEQQFDIYVDIFGQYGNCGKIVEDLVQEYPDVLQYHGRQPKSTIIPYRKGSHFLLMPSHFLETFGLTCLDAYAFGKPVIGYQKGGLRELILDNYSLIPDASLTSGQILYQKLCSVMQHFDL
jgi:glycosyltransferase involved in cell wall biosynthesis